MRERWRKWRRRRPRATTSAVAVVAVGMLLAGIWKYAHDRHDQAAAALTDGQIFLRDPHDVDAAIQSFERGIALLSQIPFGHDLRVQLHEQRDAARRQQLAQQLHRLADEVRVLYGTDAIAPATIRSIANRCDTLWQQRSAIMASLNASPELAADLQDLAIFTAHASPKEEAARLLTEAETAFGTSAVLAQERRRHDLPSTSKAAPAPRTAWEHYAVGRSLLAADELDRAAGHLAAALRLAPADRWANFYYGLCTYRMNRPSDAVAAFSACIGASPDVPGCYYNRALAYVALGRTEQAAEDYDRAIQLDPTHAPALLNRGMLRFAQGRWNDAVSDLNLALRHGGDPATVHYDLALTYASSNDRPRALVHAEKALALYPAHKQARKLRDTLHEERSAAKPGVR